MAEAHWTETIISMAGADIARAKDAMRGTLLRPVKRQPPVRGQVVQAIAAPQAFPADARQALMAQLYAKYGEQARNVMPYVVGESEGAAGV